MSPDQTHFFDLIKHSPHSSYILSHFDQEERTCDIEHVKSSLPYACSGEEYLLKFFVNVWFGSEQFPIDIVQMTRRLDPSYLKIITGWMTKPVFP